INFLNKIYECLPGEDCQYQKTNVKFDPTRAQKYHEYNTKNEILRIIWYKVEAEMIMDFRGPH
ncbi:hypothetical protein V1477_014248, partial [Vespula maculifrons]